MLPANIIEIAVVAFAYDWVHRLNIAVPCLTQGPGNERIGGGKSAKRIGQQDRRFDDPEFLNLRRSDELSKAIGHVNSRGRLALKNVTAMPWTSKSLALVGLCAISFVMFVVFAGPAGPSVAFAQVAEKLQAAKTLSYDSVVTSTVDGNTLRKTRSYFMCEAAHRTALHEIPIRGRAR